MARIRTLLFWGAAGALAMYFYDPDQGRKRRARAAQQLGGMLRRSTHRAERLSRYAASEAYGAYQRATHPLPEDMEPEDQTLAHKVESEVLGHADVPAGRINVNAEDGVVILRGEVDDEERIRSLEEDTLRIPGVRGVRNLLHLPGTPAPNKAEARAASGVRTGRGRRGTNA